jgi:hypothetical protein
MCFMAEGPSRDPIITNPSADEDTGNDSGMKALLQQLLL